MARLKSLDPKDVRQTFTVTGRIREWDATLKLASAMKVHTAWDVFRRLIATSTDPQVAKLRHNFDQPRRKAWRQSAKSG